MTTRDINWCLDMSGTNANVVTGPVHAYARFGSGLLVYNGMDVDDMGDEDPDWLARIWLFELQARFNPTPRGDLPCGVRVAGGPLPAPALAPTGLGVLAAMLGLYGTLRLRHRRASRR